MQMERSRTLQGVFERVLELQVEWDQRLTTPAMRERGQLITGEAKREIDEIAVTADGLSFEPEVHGSNGAGSANRVPWLRVYSREHAPQATSGWYLAYLFAADGSAVYLSLMQGVTDFGAGERQRVTDGLMAASDEAREFLGVIDVSRVTTEISLMDRGRRGARYELATVYAIRYQADDIPAEHVLSTDLIYMLGLLDRLYIRQTSKKPSIRCVEEESLEFAVSEGYSREQMQADTLLDESELQEIVDTLCTSSKQIILAGPPGTGKTRLALSLAKYMTNGKPARSRLVQFHPNYGYEEFVEGLRPVSDAGVVTFEVQPGTIKQMAAASAESSEVHVLIVDEMNRANLPRVFGELMFLLEYRDTAIDLQYSKSFQLPENLLLIGTMNTADRSIRSIDIALRRRFEIFECPPEAKILRRYYELIGKNDVVGLIEGFEALNEKLSSYLDKHHTVGHTYFIQKHLTPDRLRRIWTRQIQPLIEEYFFDQPDIVNEFAIEQFWPNQ